ncbi:GNAT family N-acetyltransferase [Comamonas composti]|uniref:GNAT family N-acetyltransferase n=1 Tax=Comamonas composti TaxID=408558 RepID=UPI0004049257|nr:GNAT family N-acetyltransferase [Comamonas composti]
MHQIRPARSADAPAIAALLAGIGWFGVYEATTPAQATAHVRSLIESAADRSLLLVAEHADQGLCGYCAVHWLPTAIIQGWEAYLSELFVAESARSLGLGHGLLAAAVQAARERDCLRIWLVNNRQRSSYERGFYTKQGWSEQAQMARFVLPLAPL